MGLIGRILGGPSAVSALGTAAQNVAEVFTPNAPKAMEFSAQAKMAALAQLGDEFGLPSVGWFDRMVNGLNRLPRPLLAFSTLGLFAYAMIDPTSFSERMVGLNLVPEPLWWLLGAVVGFYFGAREAYHFRNRPAGGGAQSGVSAVAALATTEENNAALADWRSETR